MDNNSKRSGIFSLSSLLPEFFIGLGYAFWVWLIFTSNMPVWGDEYFTWKVTSLMPSETVTAVLQDAHPPLYFLLSNFIFWGLSEDILAFRIFSAAYGALAVFFASLIFMRFMPEAEHKPYLKIAFLAVVFTSPFTILFFPMARYYSLVALFVAISLLLKSNKSISWLNVLGIVIFDALLLYTNFLSGLVLVGSWIYLILRQHPRIHKIKLAAILIFPWLLFLPVFLSLITTLKKISSQTNFTADFGSGIKGFLIRLGYTLHDFISGEFVYPWQISAIVMLIVGLYLLYRFIRYCNRDLRNLLAWGIFLPAIITILSSVSLFSLGMEFLPPRIAFVQPFLMIAILIGLLTIKNPTLKWSLFALILLGNLHADYKFLQKENFLHSTYIIPWNQIVADIGKNVDFQNDIVLYDDEAMDYELNQIPFFPPCYNISSLDLTTDPLSNPNTRIWLVASMRDRTPDQRLGRLMDLLESPNSHYMMKLHYGYVRESDSSIRMKEKFLGRKVEEYKKEVMLFVPKNQ